MTSTERQTKKDLIARIDSLVARMTETKHQLIRELAEPDEPNKADWYILRDKNMYYQYVATLGNEVGLVRHQGVSRVSLAVFNRDYEKATAEDVVRHLKYLKSKNIPYVEKVVETKATLPSLHAIGNAIDMVSKQGVLRHTELKALADWKANQPKGFDTSKCEFYMITVGEEDRLGNGTKVRHVTYAQAEREAMRLCEATKKEAFIVGVVASVKPVEERKVIVTVKPTVSKR